MALFARDGWEAEWDTPPDHPPKFDTVCCMRNGEQATLLIFFANPATDKGEFDISCDLRIVRPDGSISAEQEDTACAFGMLTGPPENVRLTRTRVLALAEPSDMRGTWMFEIGVTDRIRGVRIPLRVDLEFLP